VDWQTPTLLLIVFFLMKVVHLIVNEGFVLDLETVELYIHPL
jgi:hypothetical protein